jgi:hypothetical protein
MRQSILNLFSIMVKFWWVGDKGIETEAFVSKLSLFLSLPVCRRYSLLRERVGEGEKPNDKTPRKSLSFYK